ncbi:MAG: DUF6531 domain-containing protein, partial [Planctomycetia bacterium]
MAENVYPKDAVFACSESTCPGQSGDFNPFTNSPDDDGGSCRICPPPADGETCDVDDAPNVPYNSEPAPFSENPVVYATGALLLRPVDLVAPGLGRPLTHRRSFANAMNTVVDLGFGYGWNASTQPYVARPNAPDSDLLVVVLDANAAYWFERLEMSGNYVPRFGNAVLSHDTGEQKFRMILPDGSLLFFHDFDQTVHPVGTIARWEEPDDFATVVTSYAADKPAVLERTYTSPDAVVTVEQFVYDYHASGADAGRMASLTWRRQVDGGSWTDLRRVLHDYYGAGADHGNPGDLKTVVVEEWSGSAWTVLETSYYRYWKSGQAGGYEHGLKYALGPDAFSRLADAVADPFIATDAQVSAVADFYFEYDSSRRVVKERAQGATCGRSQYGVTEYVYTTSAHPEEFKNWKTKT